MRDKNFKIVEESEYGLYVWKMPNGTWVGDDNGNYMCIAARKGDRSKMEQLKKIAHHFLKDMGVEPQGGAVFLSGRRMVSDEEYEEMEMRARLGLVPDKYDVGALKEQAKYARQNNG